MTPRHRRVKLPRLRIVAPFPEFEPNQAVLVRMGEDDARAVIDAVMGERINVVGLDADLLPDADTGSELSVVHVTRSGVFTIRATVASRDAEVLALDLDPDADKLQRRRYVRIDNPLDAHVLLLDEHTGRFQPLEASVTDVSGGGLAMKADLIAPAGAVVVVALQLPNDRPVVAVGSTLPNEREDRAQLGPDAGKLRVQFTHLPEADRDRLIRHILRSAGRP